jgi:23S rRNA pseudouridine2605 synthase
MYSPKDKKEGSSRKRSEQPRKEGERGKRQQADEKRPSERHAKQERNSSNDRDKRESKKFAKPNSRDTKSPSKRKDKGGNYPEKENKEDRRGIKSGHTRGDKPFEKSKRSPEREGNQFDKRKPNFNKPERGDKNFERNTSRDERPRSESDNKNKRDYSKANGEKKRFSPSKDKARFNKDSESSRETKPYSDRKRESFSERAEKPARKYVKRSVRKENDGKIRLNKYISNSGICSRRQADEYIVAGAVMVNGKIITELGFRVSPGDIIKYGGQTISKERPVYVLLNKPKGYITTMKDPKDRKTVMALVENACRERIVPVGRLDKNTTGLLLFTNDGDMLKKLTHPRTEVKKIYHVHADKSVTKKDMQSMLEGVELEDGIAKVDEISYVEGGENLNKKEVGVELHSGKNRIVRRLFAHFEYEVIKLDRVFLGGLTKKNLPRGHWRLLTEKEIGMLKTL